MQYRKSSNHVSITMHTPQPDYEPLSGLLPVDELEERFELAQNFMKRIHELEPGFQLSSASLISFYILPLPQLRYGAKNQMTASCLVEPLRNVERAAYRCKSPTLSSSSPCYKYFSSFHPLEARR